MKIAKYVLIAALLTGATAWYGLQQYSYGDQTLPPLHTVTVDRGDVSQRVVAHGKLQPVQKVTVGSQISGIVDQIFVDFNSPVRRGQVIARIDPATFAAAVSSARAELESAEAALELARLHWKRVQELLELQFIAQSEAEQASATLRQAEAQVRVRQHALDRAQLELDRCTIYSPTDGIVISRNIDVGQTVAASLSAPNLFDIATDLGRMQIHAHVSEADIGDIKEGQAVRFKVDGYRDRDFPGEVIQVRNAPIVVDNVVHYETIIAVENEERLLKPGMTAEVAIITAERHDVLRVRNTALRARLPDAIRPADPPPGDQRNGRVYLFRDGELVAAPVRAGMSDGLNTVIEEGLQEGDVLAVGLSLRTSENEGSRRSLIGGSQAQY